MANIVQAHSRLKLELEELVPSLVESLQKVQLLRHSADSLFSNLSEGCLLKDGEEIDKDKYISIVQEKLQILVQNFNALQTKIQKIPKNRFPPIVQPLGPLGMMMLDQSEAAKKAALEYPPVFHQFNAFKDFHKILETYTYRNSRKRSTTSHQMQPAGGMRRKRPPRVIIDSPAAFKQHLSQLLHIPNILGDMKVQVREMFGNTRLLSISVRRTLNCHIILRHIQIERVIVKGLLEDENIDEVDLSENSSLDTMTRITEHAQASLIFYSFSSLTDEESFRKFLQWLRSYKTLFHAKCMRCKRHLVEGYPPTWRDFVTFQPYHFGCRSY
ncbi:unnamed protein product [Oikopleura dioica]|uniref:Mediator of RNA polymerase II transcription subunit 27 n=1 Tax=Oikopleura dioica TaxID=34765 RepID=E4WPT6_OIKDI|nr:unnamed protein product [Oikopleura dioica]